MKIELPYEQGQVLINVPDSCEISILEPNEFLEGPLAASSETAPDTVKGSVRYSLQHPVGVQPLAEFLKGGRDILVIINDATRPTPTSLVLDELVVFPEMEWARFIIATGAHRTPTDDEYRQILGSHYERLRARTFPHDARDAASLIDLGKTRNGTPILINKAVFEADRIIAIGSVEPHYFAGYTGGRKSFLPGVAGFPTIEANHKLSLSPEAHALELTSNPVSQDMDDALNLIHTPTFAIMTVLDGNQNLAWCSAGDIRASFNEAVAKANTIFAVSIPHKFDIVISSARYPMDIDLYQSQKALDNGGLALEDGGTLILVSSCRDGIGDTTFLDLMAQASTPAQVLEKLGKGYRLGYHKAAKMAAIARRAEIVAHTGLDDSTVKKAFMRPCHDLQACIDAAIAKFGARARVCVIPDGTLTVPRLVS
jgi:nickel-dependent lactate racemase